MELFQSTPPARGATNYKGKAKAENKFQSTPPARGATCHNPFYRLSYFGISIHAPREGGDQALIGTVPAGFISIHAPREGGDFMFLRRGPVTSDFNPRPPRGGRPGYQYEDLRLVVISIHAPREGGDKRGINQAYQPDNFNPRPPRGGRLTPKCVSA